MSEIVRTIVIRDLTLAMRRRSDVMTTLFFFVIVVSLFPLGIGPEMDTLRLIAPGVFWVAALLASMLALEKLFAADFEDGEKGFGDDNSFVGGIIEGSFEPLFGGGHLGARCEAQDESGKGDSFGSHGVSFVCHCG